MSSHSQKNILGRMDVWIADPLQLPGNTRVTELVTEHLFELVFVFLDQPQNETALCLFFWW